MRKGRKLLRKLLRARQTEKDIDTLARLMVRNLSVDDQRELADYVDDHGDLGIALLKMRDRCNRILKLIEEIPRE